MTFNKKIFLIRIAFGLCVFFSNTVFSQSYYKTNRTDYSSSGLYENGRGSYSFYFTWQNTPNDPSGGNNLLHIDTNLKVLNEKAVFSSTKGGYNWYSKPNWGNKVFLSLFDSANRKTSSTGRDFIPVTFKIGNLKNDTVLEKVFDIFNDTIYSFEGLPIATMLQLLDDKLFMSFTFHVKDSISGDFIPKQDFCYLNINSDSIVHLGELNRSFIDPFGTYESGKVLPSGNILKWADNTWVVELTFFKGVGTARKLFAHMDAQFDTIYQVWPTVNFDFTNASHLWLQGSTIYHFSSGSRFDPNFPSVVTEDVFIAKFNPNRDSLIRRNFIELRDTTGQFFNGSMDGAYFDGEHFVLSSWSELDPSFNFSSIALDLFTLDTNFQVLQHRAITDSSSFFRGSIQSIVPKIGDSTKVVYSGYARNPSVHPNINLFWGEYSILDNTVGLEAPIKIRRQFLQVYPNPSPGKVTVVNQRFDNAPYQLQLLGIDGKLLKEYSINEATSTLQIAAKPGTYILKWVGEEYTEVRKIIIR